MSTPLVPRFPDVYFDLKLGTYWLRLNDGRYINVTGRDAKLHAARTGFDISFEAGGMKDGDRALIRAQIENYVDWAGALAGHRAGLFRMSDGTRVLVTRQVEPVSPKNVPFEFISNFLQELFGPVQLPYVLAWLQVAHSSLSAHVFQPGQMLAMAGPANCGKSLFHYLVTQFFGGRQAKPYRYMTGESNFNGDLATSEHLFIEDEDASTDIRSRRKFGTAIKDFTVNESLSVHYKGRDAITLPFWRRLTCSCNDEAEAIMILPPMDASIMDKVMLFKCGRAEIPMDREANRSVITKELPGLVNFVQKFKITTEMQERNGNRFGVRAYHNPELLEALSNLSPEIRLLNLIDETLFGDPEQILWRGTAEKLEKQLRETEFRWAVEKLLSFSSACGTFLARLKQKFPERFSSTLVRSRTLWTIRLTKTNEET